MGTRSAGSLPFGVPVLLAISFSPAPAPAIEPEDGPAYMTDTHGAGGVCWFLRSILAVDPASERYYRGGLDWLVDTAEWDGDTCEWLVSTTAPPGHPNHKYSSQVQSIELIHGFRFFGDVRYRDTALGGLGRMLALARETSTPFGPGCWWGERVGHSHGPGGPGDFMLTAYTDLGETRGLPYAEGLLNWLRRESVFPSADVAFWPEEPGGTAYETGFCYGNAGTLSFVLDAVEVMPDFRWPDMELLEYANTNLRWLLSVAVDVPAADGVRWYYMRHEKESSNVGFGSGIAGIGLQLLGGYRLNAAAGHAALANACLDYAKRAARSILYRIHEWKGGAQPLRVGACGGEGGTAAFLLPLADALDALDPDFALQCRDTASTIADMVMASRLRFPAGSAWKSSSKFGEESVNIALDYGVTGLGLCLVQTGETLGRQEIIDAAREAAAYLRFVAVWDANGGCKWPQIIPYGPSADTDGDGVIDAWDAFPVRVSEAVDSDGDGMGDQFEWRIVDAEPSDAYEDFWDIAPEGDFDGDGRSNLDEFVAGTDPASPAFVRGDANADGALDIADAVFLLLYLFDGHAAPACAGAADANDNGVLEIADAVSILGCLFARGCPLPDPFGGCGPDPTEDALPCASFAPCR